LSPEQINVDNRHLSQVDQTQGCRVFLRIETVPM